MYGMILPESGCACPHPSMSAQTQLIWIAAVASNMCVQAGMGSACEG